MRRRKIEFVVDDYVYLNILTIKRVMRLGKKRKLSSQNISPYMILRLIGNEAYELKLLTDLALMCPIFHVSLLKKCIGDL